MHDWSENLIFLGVKRSMMLLQYFQWKRLTREYKSIMFQNLTKINKFCFHYLKKWCHAVKISSQCTDLNSDVYQ